MIDGHEILRQISETAADRTDDGRDLPTVTGQLNIRTCPRGGRDRGGRANSHHVHDLYNNLTGG